MIRIRMPAIKAMTGPKVNGRVTAANKVKFSIDLSYLKIALLLPDGRLQHKSGHQFIGLAHLQKYDGALLATGKMRDRQNCDAKLHLGIPVGINYRARRFT